MMRTARARTGSRRRVARGTLLAALTVPAVCGFAFGAGEASEETGGARIEVTVDPRIEAISIVFRLAGHSEYNQCRMPEYDEAIRTRFDAYRDHDAVKFARELRSRRGVSFDAPMSLAVQLEPGFGFEPRKPIASWPWGIDDRWTRDDVVSFLGKLRQFAKDTELAVFFREQKPLFDRLAESGHTGIADIDLKGWFDEFFGPRSDTVFHLVMAPTNGPANYGTRFDPIDPAEPREMFAILGVWAVGADGKPAFDESQLSTVVHEFCHSYVNPIVDAHLPKLRGAGERVFPKVADQMRRQAYANWETMMRESGVRACETWFMGARYGKARRATSIASQVSRGFLWTGDLVALLDTFAGERAKYPTFESFYPQFVDFYDEYAKSIEAVRLPAPTTINEVYRDRASIALIVPTHEGDRDVENRVRDYVTSIRDRLLPGALVLSDEEALEQDLTGRSLAVYGTMKGNSWLARHVAHHPVMIESGRIVTHEAFEGERLRFISCWPHPTNAERGIVVYTAQRAEDVVGINDLFHGPTGWVVAEGSEVKKAENYVITNGTWAFE